MRPGKTLGPPEPIFGDAALPAGSRWITPEGVTIRVEAATARGLDVRIDFPKGKRANKPRKRSKRPKE